MKYSALEIEIFSVSLSATSMNNTYDSDYFPRIPNRNTLEYKLMNFNEEPTEIYYMYLIQRLKKRRTYRSEKRAER